MATDSIRYVKMPGTGYRRLVPTWAVLVLFFIIGIFVLLLRGRRVELWLGPDHFLLVEWDGSREYYRRLYFRDVQAIVVRRTPDWLWTAVVLGVLVVFLIGIGLALAPQAAMYIPLGLAGVLTILAALYLAGGPTCVCQFRTAVQSVDVVSLQRVRQVRKVMALARPRIEEAQGQVSAEDLAMPFQHRVA